MILGLNDVKFEATVEDWDTGVVGQVWNDANNDGIVDPGEMVDVTDTEIGLPDNLSCLAGIAFYPGGPDRPPGDQTNK